MDLIDYDVISIETDDYKITVYMIWYNYTTGSIKVSNGMSLSRETIQDLSSIGSSDMKSHIESTLYQDMKNGNFNQNSIDDIFSKTDLINLPKFIDFKINELLK